MSGRDLTQHESPFEQGYEAFLQGSRLKDNPYGRKPWSDPRAALWCNGWREGYEQYGRRTMYETLDL